jgi:MGT family glycosyltransferase
LSLVLAYTSPARGHLFPLVPILTELRRRGHAVALRTLSSEVESLRSLGIEAQPIAPAIEAMPHSDWRARTPLGANARSVRSFAARAAHDAPDLRRAIEEERPDALLVDVMAWGALGCAEAWGGPWASFCPFPLPVPSRDAPPFGPGLPPAAGAPGRVRDRLLRRLVEAPLDRALRSQLDGVRKQLGLPGLTHGHDLFLRPPLLLYTTSEAFEYPRSDWPPNIVMIGPGTWDPPVELPPELQDVDSPFVLVTTSSEFQDDSSLVRIALEALADEPYHVVATLPAASLEGLGPPANASVLPFAPHAPILARSVCAITHGGMGATQKALARGVPVCAVPFGRDQFEVARRVEVAAAGSRLPAFPRWRLRARSLRHKVREAIACRPGAERLARSFASIDGPKIAADQIEKRLLRS